MAAFEPAQKWAMSVGTSDSTLNAGQSSSRTEANPYTANGESSSTDPKGKVRQRASTPRSKTGCITCKMRRLKCGEEKPGCLRCAKSGWSCDGYAVSSSSSITSFSTSNSSLQPPPSPGASLYSPSVSLDLNEQERRYFQVYVESMSSSLDQRGGYSDNTTTLKIILLKECYSNACVRHVIVAQGALSKSFPTHTTWGYLRNMTLPQDSHHEYSIMQYEKALRGLRTYLDGLDRGAGARATLIACLALSVFDFFCGNGGFATQHIKFGRKILTGWQSCTGESSACPNSSTNEPTPEVQYYRSPMGNPFITSPLPAGKRSSLFRSTPSARTGTCQVHMLSEQLIDDDLARMFMDFDLQALFANGIGSECTYVENFPLNRSRPPARFANLEAARQARQIMLYDGYLGFLRSLEYHFHPKTQIRKDSFQYNNQIMERLREWLVNIGPVLQPYITDPTVHPLARPEATRFQMALLLVRLTGIHHAPETSYDALYPHFEYLLAVSKDVIEYEKTYSELNLGETESFSFEVRIIPALYIIATKCRLGDLRHQAVSLLLSGRRREGIWDAPLCGKVAQGIIGLEEEAFRIGHADVIPEDMRVWGELIERDLQSRRAVVKCRQNIRGQQGRWRERRSVVYW